MSVGGKAGVAHARDCDSQSAGKRQARTYMRGGSDYQVHLSSVAVRSGQSSRFGCRSKVSVGLVTGSQSTVLEPQASWPFSSRPWGRLASERGQLTLIFSKIFDADNLT